MKIVNRMLSIATTALISAGCITLGPDYARPDIDVPDAWPLHLRTEAGSREQDGWREYQDPVLDALIEEALEHNVDLQLAMARMDEAAAALGLVRADQLPTMTVTADAFRTRGSQEAVFGLPPGIDPVYNNLLGSVNASYEIDLWGKFRRASEAARADLLATAHSRDAVRLTLIAEVARGYFNLRALDAQAEVTRRTVETRRASLELQRIRWTAGEISELEYRQVEAETAAAEAILPDLEARIARQETALSVLLGRSPRAIVNEPPKRGAAIETLSAPPVVPSGLPSELLGRRPDLREAEERLIAANARIGQAKAAYFPSISLTGLLGVESATLANLFTGPAKIWQVSASAAQLIFDGGRTGSRVAAARAREQQALAIYRSAIQNAFRDTLDALVAQRKAREIYEAEETRVGAHRRALALARLRYDNGVSSLLDVLDAERGLLDAEFKRIEARRAQLSAGADLYKALGGGWEGPAAH